MKQIAISEKEYYDKVYGCWFGKNIGGTLGAPHEGRKEILSLSYFDPMPSESAANDDLDLQLVWLEMLRERGLYPKLQDFADYWMKHLFPYPWDEYGFCQRNLQRGLRPPISGCFENDFIDQMGSPIRSEIWACVAPGDPQLAAAMAWKDAVLDHAGGEGVWGEMFWAAVESAAFIMKDPIKLIRLGLGMIPVWSLISRAVQSALWCFENDIPWEEARERILARYGHEHPCNAPQNHGFTILGWLYGDSYGDKLCKAVNCGYDTDCTGATLGSLLGILGGTKGIPSEWKNPIGDKIVLHKLTHNLDAPKDIGELTDRTVDVGKRFLAERSSVAQISGKNALPENLQMIFDNETARSLWLKDMESASVPVGDDLEIVLHYHGEPVIRPGISKILSVSVEKNESQTPAKTSIDFPKNWQVETLGDSAYKITHAEVGESQNLGVKVEVSGREFHADFVILGPEAGKDWQAARNVTSCPNCGARIEACFCG